MNSSGENRREAQKFEDVDDVVLPDDESVSTTTSESSPDCYIEAVKKNGCCGGKKKQRRAMKLAGTAKPAGSSTCGLVSALKSASTMGTIEKKNVTFEEFEMQIINDGGTNRPPLPAPVMPPATGEHLQTFKPKKDDDLRNSPMGSCQPIDLDTQSQSHLQQMPECDDKVQPTESSSPPTQPDSNQYLELEKLSQINIVQPQPLLDQQKITYENTKTLEHINQNLLTLPHASQSPSPCPSVSSTSIELSPMQHPSVTKLPTQYSPVASQPISQYIGATETEAHFLSHDISPVLKNPSPSRSPAVLPMTYLLPPPLPWTPPPQKLLESPPQGPLTFPRPQPRTVLTHLNFVTFLNRHSTYTDFCLRVAKNPDCSYTLPDSFIYSFFTQLPGFSIMEMNNRKTEALVYFYNEEQLLSAQKQLADYLESKEQTDVITLYNINRKSGNSSNLWCCCIPKCRGHDNDN